MRLPFLLGACGAALLTAQAADAPKAATPPAEPTYLTPETAGPDFLLQGEYGGDKLGADVIALGKDTFRLVLHKGGLPGAGWDGSAKTEVEGKRSGEGVSFAGAIKAELKDGIISGQNAAGIAFDMNVASDSATATTGRSTRSAPPRDIARATRAAPRSAAGSRSSP